MTREPWRGLRALEPPPGSRDRVLGAVQESVRQERRGGWAIALAVPVAAALALAWGLSGQPSRQAVVTPAEAPGRQPQAQQPQAQQPPQPQPQPQSQQPIIADPEPAPPPQPVRLHRSDRVTYAVADGEIVARGPAVLRVDETGIELTEGRVVVRGTADVRGGSCHARVSGRARVSANDGALRVRVFAGTAEVDPSATGCVVIYEDSKALPAPAPSALRQQVEAFRAARALRSADAEAALAKWRAIAAQWPDSPLRVEVDAAIAETLHTLGRAAQAAAAARAFVNRYPAHPRAPAMRAIAEGAAP